MALFGLPLGRLKRCPPQVRGPEDLDAFGRATPDRAEQGPLLLDARPAQTDLRPGGTRGMTFPAFGGDPVRSRSTRPRAVHPPLPAVVENLGHGRGLPPGRPPRAAAGHADLLLDGRGRGGQYDNGGQTPDPHSGRLAPQPAGGGHPRTPPAVRRDRGATSLP